VWASPSRPARTERCRSWSCRGGDAVRTFLARTDILWTLDTAEFGLIKAALRGYEERVKVGAEFGLGQFGGNCPIVWIDAGKRVRRADIEQGPTVGSARVGARGGARVGALAARVSALRGRAPERHDLAESCAQQTGEKGQFRDPLARLDPGACARSSAARWQAGSGRAADLTLSRLMRPHQVLSRERSGPAAVVIIVNATGRSVDCPGGEWAAPTPLRRAASCSGVSRIP
jgi:hypothetical protein